MKNKLRVWYMDRLPVKETLNMTGLEEFDDGEWGEYYDDNGESL